MSEEPVSTRRQRDQSLIELARDDLELLSAGELVERIAALEAEIVRVRAQLGRKQSGRAAADALFGGSG